MQTERCRKLRYALRVHVCNVGIWILTQHESCRRGISSGMFSYQCLYHLQRSLLWPESLKNSRRVRAKSTAQFSFTTALQRWREKTENVKPTLLLLAHELIRWFLHQSCVLQSYCGTLHSLPRPKLAQNLMNIQDCPITPMYTLRVTLHPNMHLTVVQAVIAWGVYGLKCSAGKQIRVY